MVPEREGRFRHLINAKTKNKDAAPIAKYKWAGLGQAGRMGVVDMALNNATNFRQTISHERQRYTDSCPHAAGLNQTDRIGAHKVPEL